MPVYRATPPVTNRAPGTMLPLGHSAASLPVTTIPTVQLPYPPGAPSLAQGTGSDLIATWAAPTIDGTHSAATSYNLQFSLSGANDWTTLSAVTSPYLLSNLPADVAIDVQVQSSNAAGASAWSATSTLTTAPGIPNTPYPPALTQGTRSDLIVTWIAPSVDATHNAASSFNLRSSLSGANSWTSVQGVVSPYDLTGLPGETAIDVQIQAVNAAGDSGWSSTSTLTTGSAGPFAPNAPTLASVTPPADGTSGNLAVTWTAPAVDGTHDAATGYNLRYAPSGSGNWTSISNVTSPYTITGLVGGAAIDVEVQGTNSAATPGAWSTSMTGTSWGTTVAPGNWTADATQVHGTSLAPNGGANMVVTPAPTSVTGAAFAWSSSASTVPTSGLIAAAADGQTNGWGAYFDAPATAGTYYLWMLAQGAGGSTIGALVTSAITVT
jgi:hypothetical protein